MIGITWFENKFRDAPLIRDILVILICIFGYGIPLKLVIPMSWAMAVLAGVLYAVAFLGFNEVYDRRTRGQPFFRYFFGPDPMKK